MSVLGGTSEKHLSRAQQADGSEMCSGLELLGTSTEQRGETKRSGSSSGTEPLYNHVAQKDDHSLRPTALAVKEVGILQLRRWVGVLRKRFTSNQPRVPPQDPGAKNAGSKGAWMR